jgi:hypothetical protein
VPDDGRRVASITSLGVSSTITSVYSGFHSGVWRVHMGNTCVQGNTQVESIHPRGNRSRPARSPRRGAPAVLRPGHGSALLVYRRVCPLRGCARSEPLRDGRIHTQDSSLRVMIQHVLHVRIGLVAHLLRRRLSAVICCGEA